MRRHSRNLYLVKSTKILMLRDLKKKRIKESLQREKVIQNQLQQNLVLQQIIKPRARKRRTRSDELVSCDTTCRSTRQEDSL